MPALIAVPVLVGLTLWLVLELPWNMDEFLPYHPLACRQGDQFLNVYTEACAAYATELGPLAFNRAYLYVGGTSSLLMAPALALWQSASVHYALGLLALAGTGLGIARSVMVPWRFAAVVGLYFPIVFAVLHDTGPVRVSLLALAWAPVLIRLFLQANRRTTSLASGVVLIVLCVIATEDKPFFLYLIPGAVLWIAGCLSFAGLLKEARRRWKALTLLAGACIAAPLALLMALQTDGRSYLDLLINADAYGATFWGATARATSFLLDWPYFAHRVLDFGAPASGPADATAYWFTEAIPVSLVVIPLAAALYSWSWIRIWRHPTPGTRTGLWLLTGSGGLLAIGPILSGGWANHHFVFLHLPLLGSLLLAARSLARPWLAVVAIGALSVTSGLGALALPHQPIAGDAIEEAMEVALRYAGPRTQVNCGSWGCYYRYSLANDRGAPVVFAIGPGQTQLLEESAIRRKSDVMHVCMECSAADVAVLYPRSQIVPRRGPPHIWRVFQVTPTNPASGS